MIDDWFYRTATDFRWDMHSPVSARATPSATARPCPRPKAHARCSRASRS
jgi:hypothetical protein